MNLPGLYDFASGAPGGALAAVLITALIQGVLFRPREKQATEKEKQATEKERANRRAVETDSNIKLMKEIQRLLESTGRLERSNIKLMKEIQRLLDSAGRLERSNIKLQREMSETRWILSSLVDIVERFLDGHADPAVLQAMLARAKTINGRK